MLSKPPKNIHDLPDMVMDMLDYVMTANHGYPVNLQLPDVFFEPPVFPLLQLPDHLLSHVMKYLSFLGIHLSLSSLSFHVMIFFLTIFDIPYIYVNLSKFPDACIHILEHCTLV